MERRRMKDDIQRSFLTNAIVIISAILCVYLLSLLFLFNVSIVRPSQATNERVAKEVEAEFAHYKEGMARLVADEQIRAFLRGEGKSGEVNQLLYDFRNAQTFQSDFVLLDSEEEIVATSLYEGQKEQLQQSPVLREQMQQAEEHPFTGEYVNKRAFNAGQGGAYVFAAAVEEGEERAGYLLFLLEHTLPSASEQIVFVTDSFYNAVFYSHTFGIGALGKLTIPTDGFLVQYDGNPFYVTKTEVAGQPIQVITLTSVKTYQLLLLYGLLAMVVSSFVMLAVVWLVTPKILKKTLEPFDALVARISSKNNHLHFQQTDHVFAEVQTIYEEYTNKVHEIQALVDKNEEILEKKRLSEIKHLEAKFNPHFLYNVLEMIKYETLANPESAAEMIVKTAKLMRYNAHFGDTTVLLEEDIAYLRDYFALQKMRYGKRLDYTIAIEPELGRARVPKLLLQPLIENAIKHNIDGIRCLNVDVSAYWENGVLTFVVEDNGLGITPGKMAKIKAIMAGERKEAAHTGLKNTHQMIQLLYGQRYGIDIASAPEKGEGTTVRMHIPYEG
ncbi:histidine kinase [Shouchella clausii]|uniref:sensor histidine kinase n=1 Tax=Shouchella clausii TaxID=79880 RepID=UPI00079896EA|nr:sensor histidine kinase [Shouchella clausii]KKI86046.1 hypothetical protein WZ76_11685 [Shouchella clausii]MCY1103190.1 sensor histidine kinase [Shouchella clausii]MDO7266650.1 sensor histidine kinase [Shouchella clausii]MDO7286435.1 sensor histidine kinase [Shouchella clausii]GIN09818.1 histidine kinase [Shouchella clausii]